MSFGSSPNNPGVVPIGQPRQWRVISANLMNFADGLTPATAGGLIPAPGAGVYGGTARFQVVPVQQASALRPVFTNTVGEVGGPNPIVVKFGWDFGAILQAVGSLSGGQVSATIAPNARILGDPLPIPVRQGGVYDANGGGNIGLFLQVFVQSNAAAGSIPLATYTADVLPAYAFQNAGFQSTPTQNYANAGPGADTTGSNAFPASGPSPVYAPESIIGLVNPASAAAAILVIGDSITSGTGDTGNTVVAGGDTQSWVWRWLKWMYGMVRNSQFGTTGQDWARVEHAWHAAGTCASAEFCTHAIWDYMINDLASVGNNVSAAAAEAITISGCKNLNDQGLTVYVTTVSPRVTGTAGAQVIDANNNNRILYNTWVRAGCPISRITRLPVTGAIGALIAGQAGHPVAGIIDKTALIEVASSAGLGPLTLNGGFQLAAYFNDGIHLNTAGYQAIASGLPAPSTYFGTPASY